MKFAYADPPYLGCGARHYREHAQAAYYDAPSSHRELVRVLVFDYPDGWALSCHTPSLGTMLEFCDQWQVDIRIAAWVKPFASFKPGVNPGYCWEPVIFCGGRKRARSEPTIRDFLSCNITLKKGTHGAKPDGFNDWILDLLNVQPGDRLDDLFPGSGGMAKALERRGI